MKLGSENKMKLKYFLIISISILIIGFVFVFPKELPLVFEINPVAEGVYFPDEEIENIPKLEPDKIKAIYLTGWSAGNVNRINYLINIAKTTEINAVVIDIKDYSGYVVYDTQIPEVISYNARQIRIPNIDALINRLHQEEIYLIARIVVFQDPVLARARPDLAIFNKYEFFSPFLSFFAFVSFWFDNLKLAWVDPSSEEVWNYNINIAKDALERGFDEVNFDYVRFPSDGNLAAMGFPVWRKKTPKHEVIKSFFKEVREQLPDAKISVDIFGLATVNYDDLGIGQVIEDAYEYFDYISPMVYPSHYASGFLGYENPADYPYDVVKYSMDKAQERLDRFKQLNETEEKKINAQLRPWLQDFSLGTIYDSSMLKVQIEAVKQALGENFNGFMLWNSSNIYQVEALEKEK